MKNKPTTEVNDGGVFEKDGRRRLHHRAVKIAYHDGEEFQRVYTDEARARRFAERQTKSLVVKKTKVRLIS